MQSPWVCAGSGLRPAPAHTHGDVPHTRRDHRYSGVNVGRRSGVKIPRRLTLDRRSRVGAAQRNATKCDSADLHAHRPFEHSVGCRRRSRPPLGRSGVSSNPPALVIAHCRDALARDPRDRGAGSSKRRKAVSPIVVWRRIARKEDDKRAGDRRWVGGFRSLHRQWLALRRRYAPSGTEPGDGG